MIRVRYVGKGSDLEQDSQNIVSLEEAVVLLLRSATALKCESGFFFYWITGIRREHDVFC